MKPFLLIFIFLLISCGTSKKTIEKENELTEIRSDIIVKIDSIENVLHELKISEVVKKEKKNLNANFKIKIDSLETADYNINTPNGNFGIKKSGGGNLIFEANFENNESKEDSFFSETKIENKENNLKIDVKKDLIIDVNKLKDNRQTTKQSNIFIRLWWLWLLIGAAIYILIKIYL